MKGEPFFLDQRGSIFCIVSAPAPTASPRDTGVVILNAGTIHNVGPFRLSVDLAHSLTARGFPVMRLDQTGKGESFDARRESNDRETLRRDTRLASAALEERFGVTGIAIVGLCSGADHGLQVAGDLDRAAALVMLDGWAPRDMRYFAARYLPKLRRPLEIPRLVLGRLSRMRRRPASDDAILTDVMEMSGRRWDQAEMLNKLWALCEQKVPVLAIYTGDADDYYSYPGQLRRNLSRRGVDTSCITERFNRACKHLYPIVAQRGQLVKEVTDWLSDVA